jgi:CBS domain-containing protein/DNA-binding CsgD family transcriptional regulator
MRLAEIMTSPPITVRDDAALDELAARMIGRKLGCLPVVEPEGRLVGIVTHGDFGARQGSCPFPPFCASGLGDAQAKKSAHSAASHLEELSARTARDIMTPQPIVLHEDSSVAEAVAKMLHLGFGHIPIVRHGMPVGIVARGDILRLTQRLLCGVSPEEEHQPRETGARTQATACVRLLALLEASGDGRAAGVAASHAGNGSGHPAERGSGQAAGASCAEGGAVGVAPLLTLRELEVLQWMAFGLQNKEIAHELRLSVATVRNHIHNTLEKLGVHSKLEAVSLAFRNDWVPKGAPGATDAQRI